MMICPKCKEEQAAAEFVRKNGQPAKWCATCRAERSRAVLEARENNPERKQKDADRTRSYKQRRSKRDPGWRARYQKSWRDTRKAAGLRYKYD
jgi:hypothetical protein